MAESSAPVPVVANDPLPPLQELGATSAPLKSAAYFIGDQCKEFNEDFMLCKNENRDPAHCLAEGRKVTRCAADVLNKLRAACVQEFEAHWNCLEWNNQYYYACRKEERPLNACAFTKLGYKKEIPGSPEGKTPIHLIERPYFKRQQK
ncbi:putative NADH dehydrogenase 22K chain precursor [Calocera cornea HHB12733]|uniref:NADH-ubiquinone oxidoreductase n=1 Tax=Calocera cornea HHB12733 TaxID=1353952 RepID=A0A165I5S8_9BASI|nr:putative NADH dehydrogenase 22K chain precursor [Calocera cornea HHB12733]